MERLESRPAIVSLVVFSEDDRSPFSGLIQKIISSSFSQEEVQAIILAHEHFAPSELFLSSLIFQFKKLVQSTNPDDKDSEILPVRMINFIKNWIKFDRTKFKSSFRDLGKILHEFIATLPAKWGGLLQSMLDDQIGQLDDADEDSDDAVLYPEIIKKKASPTDCKGLLAYEAQEIARQLCLIDVANLMEVGREELLHVEWTKDNGNNTPGLTRCAKRADCFAHWIAHELITAGSKVRVRLLVHMLTITHHLIQYQNFQSSMSFYLGLNLTPVVNLRLFEHLSKNMQEVWRDIRFLFDYNNNFRNYRNKIKTLTPPLIINQEIVLKDLLFNEEIASTLEDGDDGVKLVNMSKLNAMGSVINSFMKCQKSAYHFVGYSELSRYLNQVNNTEITLDLLEKLVADNTSSHSNSNSSSCEDSGSRMSKERTRDTSKMFQKLGSDHESKKDSSGGIGSTIKIFTEKKTVGRRKSNATERRFDDNKLKTTEGKQSRESKSTEEGTVSGGGCSSRDDHERILTKSQDRQGLFSAFGKK